jgi:hypothetical protein
MRHYELRQWNKRPARIESCGRETNCIAHVSSASESQNAAQTVFTGRPCRITMPLIRVHGAAFDPGNALYPLSVAMSFNN